MIEINDSDLLMFLDNVADTNIKRAIELDEKYLARALELKYLQRQVTGVLYRLTCPPSLVLGEYHLGLLIPVESIRITKHIDECLHCRRELEELMSFVKPTWFERVIARLFSGGEMEPSVGWLPDFGVRGAAETPYVYEAGDIQIAIDVQVDNLHPTRKAIIGLISGASTKDFNVTVWAEGGQPSEAVVDDLNYFKVGNLARGEYEILIRGPKLEILVQKFIIF